MGGDCRIVIVLSPSQAISNFSECHGTRHICPVVVMSCWGHVTFNQAANLLINKECVWIKALITVFAFGHSFESHVLCCYIFERNEHQSSKINEISAAYNFEIIYQPMSRDNTPDWLSFLSILSVQCSRDSCLTILKPLSEIIIRCNQEIIKLTYTAYLQLI